MSTFFTITKLALTIIALGSECLASNGSSSGVDGFGFELLVERIDFLENRYVTYVRMRESQEESKKLSESILHHLKEAKRPASGDPCYESQQPVNQTKKYFVSNIKAKFLEAWRLCQTAGHRMATITSAEDNRLLEQTIAKSGTSGPWFIGGTDYGSEGHFVWISTNKPIGYLTGYQNYASGQPDNNGNENCLEIGRWGGTYWNDIQCDWKQRYICERFE